MIGIYLKIAWRNIHRNMSFSSINILGLALGLTCSMLIFLWVQEEYKVDAFHKDGERIYVVTSRAYVENEVHGGYGTPGLLGEEIKKVIPEVEMSCSFVGGRWFTLAAGEKVTKQPGNFAGSDFLKIFTYPLLYGTAENALTSPVSISISRKLAVNLFGGPEQACNQTVRFENYRDLKVTAVFEDLPDHSSEQFEFLINWDLNLERDHWLKEWHSSGPTTFIKLKTSANAPQVQSKIQHFVAKYDKDYTDQERLELDLQPYAEKYLHSNFKNGYLSGGRIEYVRLFSLIAIFILLIACINFMNLSTARSLKRAKEIGVRKVIGAGQSSLVKQFLGEALLFSGMAIGIALVLVYLILPGFNHLTNKHILPPFYQMSFWMVLVVLTIITGLIAGSYPAFLLSSFKPIAVLKSNVKLYPGSGIFRKSLVVFQFTLSIVFIIGMMTISRQVDFIQTKNLGYHKNNLIYLPLSGDLSKSFRVFKNEALKLPGIKSMGKMSQRPIELENGTVNVSWEGKPQDSKSSFTQVAIGFDFIKTMEAELLKGRDFSEDFSDSTSFLINETAMQKIGYQDPIGKPLTLAGKKGSIVGVVRDFHFNSFYVPIEPLILHLSRINKGDYALIRTEPGKTQVALEGLKALHKKLNPEFPFAHQFADEEYSMMYKNEQVIKQLSTYFAFLAIFISCLGLLGLVIFTAEQRTREIGIRKVMGASIGSLFSLLSFDFLKLVGLAFLIAVPIAWWSMNQWMANYAYRVGLGWQIFALAGIAGMGIALVTVSYQAIRAARANPVKSLRME